MTWKEDKNLGPWPFEKSGADNRYNEGNLISSSSNPVWNITSQRGLPTTSYHNPCGYWIKDYSPNPPIPPAAGIIYGSGNNNNARLSVGDATARNVYTISVNTELFQNIKCSPGHSLALKDDGSIWGCGNSNNGAYVLTGLSYAQGFGQIDDSVYTHITGSSYCSAFVKDDGTLWVCGIGTYGKLGLGDTNTRYILTQVGSDNNWVKVVFGGSHTIALKTDGTIWTCGTNYSFCLGLQLSSEFTTYTTFQQVGIHVNDTCPVSGYTDIAAGSRSIYALHGTDLYGAGSNYHGELGFPNSSPFYEKGLVIIDTNVDSFYSGNTNYAVFTLKDNNLYGTGENSFNQLGIGTSTDVYGFTPVASNVQKVSTGYYSSLYIDTNNKLWGTGHNIFGELGLGDNNQRNIWTQIDSINEYLDIQISESHSLAIRI